MKWFLISALMAPVIFYTDAVPRPMSLPWARRAPSPVQADQPDECLSGDGRDYRGTVSETHRGRKCLYWDQFGRGSASLGLGSHNYCRNTDHRLKPWCHVRRGRRIVREFCDIPSCKDTETTCGERPKMPSRKVVGGTVSSVESHPWIASIFGSHGFVCGGSLISPCWVLTAAHCFPDGKPTITRKLTVYMGKNAINETDSKEQKFAVDKLIFHPDYNFNTENYNNDIALLKIESMNGRLCAERTGSVRTVCLPPSRQMLPPGSYCDIAGYGKEQEDAWAYSRYLREAQVKLLSQNVCQQKDYYGNMVTNNMFCAGSPDWKIDSCKGDSGGPLVCEVKGRMFLFGIISWGDGCSRKFQPGVYTRVTNYNRWIAEQTGLPSFAVGSMYPKKP